jgi:urease accessory protein
MTHSDGLLRLRFERDSRGRSYLAAREQRFPLHLTAPLYLDPTLPGMAFVYTQNPTGGIFGGDQLTIDLAAGAATEVHLTSTAATKAYRSESGDAIEKIELAVERGAYLEYLPEPLIPQAGSRLSQRVTVDLEDGATFLMADVVSGGRVARGEVFAFDRLERRTTVRRNRTEVAVDALCLEPARWAPGKRGVLGNHTYMASLMVVAPQAESAAWRQRIFDTTTALSGVLAGAGSLPGDSGVVVRILSSSLLSATRSLEALWHVIRMSLDKGSPPRRRK